MKEFFTLLFDSGDGICTGSAYANEVNKYAKEGEFFCVNPLDSMKDHAAFLKEEYNEHVARRADLNVSCFRNFIFEMDSLPVGEQLNIFRNSVIPFTSIVFSGSKSYHAILSVEDGACDNAHTMEGIEEYKHIWRRLAARLDREAVKAGHKYPDGKPTFIDVSCKNPSRLTRYPDMVRDNGNVQELVQLTERMDKSEFLTLLSECPTVLSSQRQSYDAPEDEIETVDGFKAICPPELMRKLKIVDWAGSEGMYPHLRDYTLWAIDATNVSRDAFVEFLEEYTFKSLLRRGYPSHKLMTGVDHAFKMKGR